MKEHQREFARALLDETGPLGILRADLAARMTSLLHGNELLTGQLATLHEKIAVADAQKRARERGTTKGIEFEEAVANAVESIHAPLEDIVQRVGNELGVSGGRVGDVVVDVNPLHLHGRSARVAIEAKCRKLSMKAALAELDKAMLNRDSQAGVLVFAGADLAPLHGHSIRVCAGDRVLVVLDEETGDTLPLEAACTIARAAASRKANQEDSELSAERLDRLDRYVRQLTEILDEARAISRGITKARNGVDQIDGAYTAMRTAALAVVTDIEDELSGKSE